MFVDVGIAFGAGVLSFLSPCFLPLVPAYLVYLGGRHVNAVRHDKPAQRAVFINALAFILGFGTIFVALGVAITFVGIAFQQGLPTMRLVGGALLVIFGLSFLGFPPHSMAAADTAAGSLAPQYTAGPHRYGKDRSDHVFPNRPGIWHRLDAMRGADSRCHFAPGIRR